MQGRKNAKGAGKLAKTAPSIALQENWNPEKSMHEVKIVLGSGTTT
jgi:hypothetical protein